MPKKWKWILFGEKPILPFYFIKGGRLFLVGLSETNDSTGDCVFLKDGMSTCIYSSTLKWDVS